MDLPGHELVSVGLADLAAGRESETSLVVAMAAPRLRALGFDVPINAVELGRVARQPVRISLTGGSTSSGS
jgi:hypothetical protein